MIFMYATGYKNNLLNFNRTLNSGTYSGTSNKSIANASSEDKVKSAQQLINEANQHADLAQVNLDNMQLTESVDDQVKYMESAEDSINLATDKIAEAARLLEVSINASNALNASTIERMNASPNLLPLIENLKLTILNTNEKIRKIKEVVKVKKTKLDEITKVIKMEQQNASNTNMNIFFDENKNNALILQNNALYLY